MIKVFEGVVTSRIAGFLESNKLLNSNQHGFRCDRNSLTRLLCYIDDILEALGTGSNSDVMYLDFSKVINRVDHNILLSKLSSVGIRGKLQHWIEYSLENRTQHVIGEVHSNPAKSPVVSFEGLSWACSSL
ncbi:uncharacterized protein LOC106868779 [Octopus bimaculoides]|uniref:uncharacterized protein LOC106868779 n=1 Tax=Octopus bimaculoides TaxID=37653 RepID=UPI00071D9A06|nr:uncharacterized protein LOC106868779 [Octopus bimaculoides]|eukprot:XP_014769683.1 PREDICTED: uncharacterized protein LOC106868779 [Octopus bimaculoides]